MASESEVRASGYSLLRYGMYEYPNIIAYHPSTTNPKYDVETYRFVASNIKGCYISWSRSLPSGEVKIGNKIYLSIPNGWDERLQYYPWYTGHRYWQYNQWNYPEQNYGNTSISPKGARGNEGHYNYYHGNETNLPIYMNKNRFNDKLLVWLKDYEPKASDDMELSPIITDPSAPSNKCVNVRMKIFVQNDMDTVSFGIRFSVKSGSSITYSYDFGDGYTSTYTQNTSLSSLTHQYLSAGYYIVDVIIDSHSNDDSNISLYFDDNIVRTPSYDNVLRSIYIRTPYHVSFDRLTLSKYNSLSYVYLSIPNKHFNVNAINNTIIDNLYVMLNSKDQHCGNVCISNTNTDNTNNSIIQNVYLSSITHKLDIGMYRYTGIEKVYFYSLVPVTVISYNLYDPVSMDNDFSSISALSAFYVRNSILTKSKELNKNLPLYAF